MALELWKRATTRLKRVYLFLLCFLLLVGITVAGTLTPLTKEEADALNKEIQDVQVDIGNMTVLSGTMAIFNNNFLISLLMFVPFFGPLFGGYVTYNTGLVIAAQTMNLTEQISPTLAFLVLLILPFAWMEFIAYSLAFSESLWLSWCVIKRKSREELLTTLTLILVCLLILLAAAFIEMALISAFSAA